MSSTQLTNSDNTAKSVRNSSIELLRILAMCGVVILHYNNESIGGGLGYATGINHAFLMVLESLFICAVNLYILISGYFMSTTQKRSLNKPFVLLAQVCIFGAGIYVLRCLVSGGWSVRSLLGAVVPNNYFVSLYVTLYLISPYLNRVLQQLSEKKLGVLVILLFVLFSVWPTAVDVLSGIAGRAFTGLSTVNAFASQRGYTIVQFVLMYVLGAYIRREQERLVKLPAIGLLLGCVALIWLWASVSTTDAWAYHNPLVVLCACAALLIALRRQFRSKFINHLAASGFTCFLLHDLFIHRIGISWASTAVLPVLMLHVILSVAGIYLISHCAHLIWELISKPIFGLFAKYISKLDPLVSLGESDVSAAEK